MRLRRHCRSMSNKSINCCRRAGSTPSTPCIISPAAKSPCTVEGHSIQITHPTAEVLLKQPDQQAAMHAQVKHSSRVTCAMVPACCPSVAVQVNKLVSRQDGMHTKATQQRHCTQRTPKQLEEQIYTQSYLQGNVIASKSNIPPPLSA